MTKKDELTLQISRDEVVTVKCADIDYAEYKVYWSVGKYPGIKVFMKDGTVYTHSYATEFKDIANTLRKNKVKFID